MFVEEIEHNGKVFAIIVREGYNRDGIHFLSKQKQPLQLGLHVREKGIEIKPHIHKPFLKLENVSSQEAFYIVYGEVRVDLYDGNIKIATTVLKTGDAMVLTTGGHGIKFLKDTKMLEIKQGPYRGVHEEKEYI